MEKFTNILSEIDKTREAIKTVEAKEHKLYVTDIPQRIEALKVAYKDAIKK